MIIEKGLNSKDWKELISKIKRANTEQLEFIKLSCDSEIIKRNKQ